MQNCMGSDGPGWELWRTFDAVMREGSLSAAARTLSLTQPTAGRHIAELEAALGAGALFTRSGRGLQPTEVAEALAPHAQVMAAAAAALVRAASAGCAGGVTSPANPAGERDTAAALTPPPGT
jgi:DNA-binding transcriptional LysR family regulator